MKFSRVKQFLKSKKVIRTGACVLAAVIVTGGVGAYHVYGQKAKTAQKTTQERDAAGDESHVMEGGDISRYTSGPSSPVLSY